MKKYLEKEYYLEGVYGFKSSELKVIENIMEMVDTMGYNYTDGRCIYYNLQGDKKINFDEDISYVIEYFHNTGKIDIIGITEEKTATKDTGINKILLLRPYWKNIVARSILSTVQENRNVIGAIREKDLYDLKCEVKFDTRPDLVNNSDWKHDEKLFEEARKDTEFIKIFAKNIINNFLKNDISIEN